MKHISFLIKPASSTCNMRCRYCFYADVAEHRETPNHGIMDAATYQAIVDRAFTRVLDAIAALRRAGADFNILTVLTDQLARHPQKLYRFYKQHKFDFVQLIHTLRPIWSPSRALCDRTILLRGDGARFPATIEHGSLRQ